MGERTRTKAHMMTPDDWPMWPYQPVERDDEIGVLADEQPDRPGAQPKVYLRDIRYGGDAFSECRAIEYATFDALLDAGWKVAQTPA